MDMAIPGSDSEVTAGPSCAPLPVSLAEVIAQVWCSVFCRERIGYDENFFELGGNSVLGLDLAGHLSDRLDLQVPVLVLFQYPTIREMAEVIAADSES